MHVPIRTLQSAGLHAAKPSRAIQRRETLEKLGLPNATTCIPCCSGVASVVLLGMLHGCWTPGRPAAAGCCVDRGSDGRCVARFRGQRGLQGQRLAWRRGAGRLLAGAPVPRVRRPGRLRRGRAPLRAGLWGGLRSRRRPRRGRGRALQPPLGAGRSLAHQLRGWRLPAARGGRLRERPAGSRPRHKDGWPGGEPLRTGSGRGVARQDQPHGRLQLSLRRSLRMLPVRRWQGCGRCRCLCVRFPCKRRADTWNRLRRLALLLLGRCPNMQLRLLLRVSVRSLTCQLQLRPRLCGGRHLWRE
mmetsp:Transcript_105129/g.339055  ORF Transcript_105129/g.339055 Transcript_105129/m.339055 type:complete len:301 (-) Transcript_105129:1295-2197(-)